ncbi:MAG TPA: amidohydrolase family protein [Mycobacteriales bacterium]|nr:amidohydrolase family protein [Mycobacteriales bacterium]
MTITLLRGGHVHTPLDRHATAMLIHDDTITWVGTDTTDTTTPDTVVDLDGALVTPCFVDAHVHLTSTGLALDGLDLAGTPTLAAALDALADHATATGATVVLGTGWDETTWPEHRPPTPAELDRATGGAMVYLSRVDAHSAVVSTALLAATPQARDLAGYHPGGHARLDAHHALRDTAYAAIPTSQFTAAQRTARAHAASLGIGCLHEMAGPNVSGTTDVEALLALAATEPGPDIIAYWGELGAVDTVRELGLAGAAGDLFCDGSLGSHTAAVTTPYTDRPDTSGHLKYNAEQIGEHLAACTRAGIQGGFHAIGDAALAAILDGAALAAQQVGPERLAAAGHRVEHAEMPPDVGRFARHGLLASVQPAFDAFWGGEHGMYAARLGPHRAGRLNPLAGFAAAGVPLALGSDSPVTPMDPWGGVRAAVHHRTPGFGLPARAAFAAATRGGWRAARRDAEGIGTLTPGAPASYAVWNLGGCPPLTPTGLPDLSPGVTLPACQRTVVRGRTIFERLR